METTSETTTEALAIRPRCPACADTTWSHVDELTEFPMFSGWECSACGYFELDP